MHAKQRGRTIGPRFAQCDSVVAARIKTQAMRVVRGYFETRRVDQTIDRVFDAIDHNARWCDGFDTFAISVDERHVGAVKRRQVFIVETKPFAELVVVGLQRFCGLGVVHNVGDAGPHAFHVFEIDAFEFGFAFFSCGRSARVDEEHLGPTVLDEVNFGLIADDQCGEVVDAFLLPAGLQ